MAGMGAVPSQKCVRGPLKAVDRSQLASAAGHLSAQLEVDCRATLGSRRSGLIVGNHLIAGWSENTAAEGCRPQPDFRSRATDGSTMRRRRSLLALLLLFICAAALGQQPTGDDTAEDASSR